MFGAGGRKTDTEAWHAKLRVLEVGASEEEQSKDTVRTTCVFVKLTLWKDTLDQDVKAAGKYWKFSTFVRGFCVSIFFFSRLQRKWNLLKTEMYREQLNCTNLWMYFRLKMKGGTFGKQYFSDKKVNISGALSLVVQLTRTSICFGLEIFDCPFEGYLAHLSWHYYRLRLVRSKQGIGFIVLRPTIMQHQALVWM